MEWIFWFLILGGGGFVVDFLTGTGNFFTRIADGRRKAARLKIENKALRNIQASRGTLMHLPSDTPNAKLLALLYQVQLADEAYPQLDPRLRTRIDEALAESEEKPQPLGIKKSQN
jgi:hypothetical protein